MAEFGAKSCSNPGCPLHDFLPYTCPACDRVFCTEHYSISAHVCEKGQAYLASRNDGDAAIPAAGARRPHPLPSSKPSEVMAAVTSRFDGREDELNTKVSHYNIKTSASEGYGNSGSVAADRRLKDAKIALDRAPTEKEKRVSSQVLKMLVKSKAVGDKNLRMEDRFFLEVHYWNNDQDVHNLFFSRLWTVGRVLDEIVKTRRHFLRLEPELKDAPLELARSDSRGKLPAGGVLHDLAPRLQSFDAVTVRPQVPIDPAVAEEKNAEVVSGSELSVNPACVQQIEEGKVEAEQLSRGDDESGADAANTGNEGLSVMEKGEDSGGARKRSVGSSDAAAAMKNIEGGMTIAVGHGKTVHLLSGILNCETVLDLKRRLEPLTGVPFMRQKLVFKGILRDADLVGETKIVDGAKLMLLGTPASGGANRK
ncbi:unnamed protein product [Ascophyllum nodosum]